MRIQVVNPNTTMSMTRRIGEAAKAAALPAPTIVCVNPDFGPPSIEGYFDEVFSVPGLLAEIGKAKDFDAHIIACFDDTGLEAARCLASAPVIGIGEAAFHMACLIAAKFSVVTTLSRSVPAIEHNLIKYGLVESLREGARIRRRRTGFGIAWIQRAPSAFRTRSRWLSARIARRRLFWDAPAWRNLRPLCRSNMAFRCLTASLVR